MHRDDLDALGGSCPQWKRQLDPPHVSCPQKGSPQAQKLGLNGSIAWHAEQPNVSCIKQKGTSCHMLAFKRCFEPDCCVRADRIAQTAPPPHANDVVAALEPELWVCVLSLLSLLLLLSCVCLWLSFLCVVVVACCC